LAVSRGDHARAIQILEKLVAESPAPDRKTNAQLGLARIHMAQKNQAAAEPIIADILARDSRNVDALRLRAAARIEQGQLENAIADLRQALNDQPQSAPLLQLLANALERTGAIELAEKHHSDATRASNFEPSVGLQYVAFLQRRRSAAHAEEVLTEIASRHPNNLQVLTALAQTKLQRQDWAGAQEVADAIKRMGDQQGVADQIRGIAFSGQNKLNESVQALQAALQASAQGVQPMVALVRTYMRAQKVDEAETFLKGVLSANPANAEALVLMGSVQFAKNAPAQAEKYFKDAIERQPRSPVGYGALAESYIRANDLERALQVVRDGLAQQPDNFGLRLLLASTLERKADYNGAIKEYEAMLARQPDSLIVANNLASLLSDYRSDKASLDRAQALGAILRKSNIPHFKDTVGWLSYQQGDYRTAVAVLEEAAEALPDMAEVRYHLGMSYLKAGQVEKGQEQLRKAAELAEGRTDLKNKIAAALRDS
jgi:tetratricopeptide (TPR) repeat protein